jgi:hypothetical protein
MVLTGRKREADMADDLDLNLHSITGEGPSPDFVARLREQVAVELAKSAADLNDEFVVDVDLRPNEKEHAMTKTRWMLVVGAAAAIALIVGLVAVGGDSDEGSIDNVITADESTTTPDPEPTAVPPTPVPTPVPPPPVQATFDPGAEQITGEFNNLNAGTYRVDGVGTPFSFTAGNSLSVQSNNLGTFVLSLSSSQGPGDRDMVFTRLTGLFDPAHPDVPLADLDDLWPSEDFAGWLDNLVEGVVVSNREETTLGGLDAIKVDLEIDASVCSANPGGGCADLGTNRLATFQPLNPGAMHRIWVVDQDDQTPMTVIVNVDKAADSDWFDTAEELLATLVFGDVGPNPMQATDTGLAEATFLGGIRMELAAGLTMNQETDDFGRVLFDPLSAAMEFLYNPLQFDGDSIETADAVVAVLTERGIGVTEIEPTMVDGIEARVFETDGRSTTGEGGVLRRYADDDRGWFPPLIGQLWLIEHPERGLMMITAETWGETADELFPQIIVEAGIILGSLEFVELG